MGTIRIVLIAASSVIATLSMAFAEAPVAVSPAGVSATACPTFSWSLHEGVSGYELVVYRVAEADQVAPVPVLSARLPAGVQSWTASAERCLEPGGAYAWSLRALGQEGAGDWSEAALFEVASAPSIGEVEAAIETLRRYLAEQERNDEDPSEANARARFQELVADRAGGVASSRWAALRSPSAAEPPKSVVAASVPSLGTPSLTVDANVALGTASNLFKDGSVFLWDDTTGNTALGRLALRSNTGGFDNTAMGYRALYSNLTGFRNTALGLDSLRYNTDGYQNTAGGWRALRSNISGHFNTAFGDQALSSNDIGNRNTAVGFFALRNTTEGARNTAVGVNAGLGATTGNDNIFLGSGAEGTSSDSNTIRIGGSTGTSAGQQNRTFIAGITGIGVTGNGVLVSSSGQLGVATSSLRFKEEIAELGEVGERLAALRPVTFRYRPELVAGGGGAELGLIAEEVAEVFPELVTRDEERRPFGVRYELLSVVLLEELQRQERELDRQRDELRAVRNRLETLESESSPRPRVPWWRRLGARDRDGTTDGGG